MKWSCGKIGKHIRECKNIFEKSRFRIQSEHIDSHNHRLAQVITYFAYAADLYAKLSAKPNDFGTDERLYRSEIHVLEAIGRGQSCTCTELGISFGITTSAVSQVVSMLDAKGCITKERNPPADQHECGRRL